MSRRKRKLQTFFLPMPIAKMNENLVFVVYIFYVFQVEQVLLSQELFIPLF
jgi:hypothetical protein